MSLFKSNKKLLFRDFFVKFTYDITMKFQMLQQDVLQQDGRGLQRKFIDIAIRIKRNNTIATQFCCM